MASSTRPGSTLGRHHNRAYRESAGHEPSTQGSHHPMGSWHTPQDQAGPADGTRQATHDPMARAIVMYGWDGTIPGHVVKGPFVDGGNVVDICAVVDASWYRVHYPGACKLIPRSFLDVVGVYNQKYQALFRVGGSDPEIVDIRYPYIPPEPPTPNFVIALCCGIRPPPNPYNRGVRPSIPAPPFE